MQQNINWTALVGLVATLAALFGFDIPADVQVKLIAGIDSLTFVIIWLLHTFVNTPKSQRPKMLGFGKHAHTLLVLLLAPALLLATTRCAGVVPDPFANDWQQGVYNASTTFNSFASTANTICGTVPVCGAARPKLCSAERVFWHLAGPDGAQSIVRDSAKDKDDFEFAINTARTALTAFVEAAAEVGLSIFSAPRKAAISHDPLPEEWDALNAQVSATLASCGA